GLSFGKLNSPAVRVSNDRAITPFACLRLGHDGCADPFQYLNNFGQAFHGKSQSSCRISRSTVLERVHLEHELTDTAGVMDRSLSVSFFNEVNTEGSVELAQFRDLLRFQYEQG